MSEKRKNIYSDDPLEDEFFQAAMNWWEEKLELLIEKGVDPNCRDKGGKAPIDYTIGHKNLESTRWMLDHGAHVDTRDSEGGTPLMHVVSYGGWSMQYFVELLLKYNADFDVVDNNGATIFDRDTDYHRYQKTENREYLLKVQERLRKNKITEK